MGGQKNRQHSSGASVSVTRPPQTAKEVKDILAATMADVHTGRLEPKVGTAMAYMGTALLKAIETAEMEDRIEAWND